MKLCALFWLVVSYDIACQYFKKFWERHEKMPRRLQTAIPPAHFQEKIPKAHIQVHTEKCHGPFNFNYTPGVGRTMGEGIESNWCVLNKAAPSCKEMGPSSRRETLDDYCAFSNWSKTIGLGKQSC